MLKFSFLAVMVLSSFTVVAAENNLYDQFMGECLGVSGDQRACHRQAKTSVLADPRTSGDFLSCIDYGHSSVSLEWEADCLREISWLQ